MVSILKNRFKNLDFTLMIAIIFLASFGLLMIYSSSGTYAVMNGESANYFLMRQLRWFLLGLSLMIFIIFVPYELYRKMSPLFIILSIILLITVLLPGVGEVRNNSQRWIGLGSFQFQPAEIIKLFMIMYFAFFYSQKQELLHRFKDGVLPPLIILTAVFLLILQQPDLGSAALIVIACGIIVICSGIRMRHIFMLASVAIVGILYFAISSRYRMERITSFLNPFENPDGDGYQLINSYVAIGTGGIEGVGIGNSVQKLGFLPEAHTDFIMAVTLEELGLLGLLFVIGSYAFIMFRGIEIAKNCSTLFPKLLSIGIVFQIMTQVVFNLGAVSGLLPITGITLPLISYGGSSVVITMISLGILLHISTRTKEKTKKVQQDQSMQAIHIKQLS